MLYEGWRAEAVVCPLEVLQTLPPDPPSAFATLHLFHSDSVNTRKVNVILDEKRKLNLKKTFSKL